MAMLAEQRKKKRWSMNPRGNLWSNDENKFGQKLLEKMGWSKGKGLGKEEQGCKDPIRLSTNDDQRGVGYKGKSDLEWTKHYDAFENVLSNLNSVNNTADDTTLVDEESIKGAESLEKKSKKSKSRVHYHKFTRGKDLSKYNDDDLACILGSKRLKSNITERDDKPQFSTPSIAKKEDSINDQTDNSHGLTTIHGGNLKEYFSQKMIELKRKREEGIIGYTGNTDQNNEEINDVSFPNLEFEPEKLSFSFNVSQSINNEVSDEDNKSNFIKIKKSKRNEEKNLEEAREFYVPTTPVNSEMEKKDKKKVKHLHNEIIIEEANKTKKKKKKKSHKEHSEFIEFSEEEIHPKISKKKEKSQKNAKENRDNIEDINESEYKSPLKSYTKITVNNTIHDIVTNNAFENLDDNLGNKSKKKKNKKKKLEKNINNIEVPLNSDCVDEADNHDLADGNIANQSQELNESYGIAMSSINEKKRKHKERDGENQVPLKKIKKLTSELNIADLFKSSTSLVHCDEANQGKSLTGKKVKLSAKKSFKELKSGVEAKLKRIKEIYNEHELQEKVTEDENVIQSNEKESSKSSESTRCETDITIKHNLKEKLINFEIQEKLLENMSDLFPGSNLDEIKGYD